MRLRGRSIRRKIVALLLVPLLCLVGLWAFAAAYTVRDVLNLMDVARMTDAFAYPVEDAIQAVQKERRSALVYLADPEGPGAGENWQRSQAGTDKQLDRVLAAARDQKDRSLLSGRQRQRLDTVVDGFEGLDALRSQVVQRRVSGSDAFQTYTDLIEPGYSLLTELSTIDSVDLAQQARTLIELTRARESVTREDAVVSAALVSGRMAEPEFRLLSDAVAQQRLLYRLHLPELPREDREAFAALFSGAGGKALAAMEEELLAAGAGDTPKTIDAGRWRTSIDAVMDGADRVDRAAVEHYKQRARPFALRVIVIAAVVGGVGLLAVVLSLVISVRVGRGLVRDLTGLRKAALELSGTRLPRLMRRLAAGEQLDVDAEAPPLKYVDDDEIGQVGKAFSDVQRAAVEAAVKQAEMRRGVSEVFVNLARRSQVLLHRQLTLLDTMERRTEDAEELADLFRLDHMTTRMRRHAEGLVILSGAAPARAWRKPVRLINVVRAAVSEVEDYERVQVRRMARLAVVGAAVADVTHLIAELIENATVYSPPHTQVHVHGERVGNGFVLEIDDRGLGMSQETLLEANQRLAETPEFELSDTDRLGLFVVSRLAQRHGVRVSLSPSAYGGTTAVVFIPTALLTDETDDANSGELPLPSADAAADEGQAAAEALQRTEYAFHEWGLGPDPQPNGTAPDSQEPGPDAAPQAPEQPVELPRRRRRSPVLVADLGTSLDRTPQGAPRPERPRRAAEDVAQAPAGQEAGPGGLPRRVRQASLAPQLRAGRPDPRGAPGGGGGEGGAARRPDAAPVRERSAEEVRSRMASFQRGWQRGRSAPDDTAGRVVDLGGPDLEARRSTTREGDGR